MAIKTLTHHNYPGVTISGNTVTFPKGTTPMNFGLQIADKIGTKGKVKGAIKKFAKNNVTVLTLNKSTNGKEVFTDQNNHSFTLKTQTKMAVESVTLSASQPSPGSPEPVVQQTSQPISESGNDEKGCCLSRIFSCVFRAMKAFINCILCRSSALSEKHNVEGGKESSKSTQEPVVINKSGDSLSILD